MKVENRVYSEIISNRRGQWNFFLAGEKFSTFDLPQEIYLPTFSLFLKTQSSSAAIMASIQNKIARTANAPSGQPTETETTVAQAFLDLESNVPELKAELRSLQFSAAKEVDVKGGKKAIVIFVPVPQLKAFHKIQQR